MKLGKKFEIVGHQPFSAPRTPSGGRTANPTLNQRLSAGPLPFKIRRQATTSTDLPPRVNALPQIQPNSIHSASPHALDSKETAHAAEQRLRAAKLIGEDDRLGNVTAGGDCFFLAAQLLSGVSRSELDASHARAAVTRQVLDHLDAFKAGTTGQTEHMHSLAFIDELSAFENLAEGVDIHSPQVAACLERAIGTDNFLRYCCLESEQHRAIVASIALSGSWGEDVHDYTPFVFAAVMNRPVRVLSETAGGVSDETFNPSRSTAPPITFYSVARPDVGAPHYMAVMNREKLTLAEAVTATRHEPERDETLSTATTSG